MGLDPYTNILYVETGCETINYQGKTSETDVPGWDADQPKYQLAYVSENLWKLNVGNLRDYYGITDTKEAITPEIHLPRGRQRQAGPHRRG